MKDLLKDISFETAEGKLADIFGDKAEKIAKKLDGDIKTTQFRKFYDKILELNDKAGGLKSPHEYPIKISPFVKMLNSKVQYSKTRGHSGENFVTLMSESIKKVNNPEELQNFKYFLESIIGFMPKN